MVSLQNSTDPTDMKTVSSCSKGSVEKTPKPKNIRKDFEVISTYFSEEEWAKLTKWQKSAYVYMRRNYIRMTGLGVTVNQPVFMRGKEELEYTVHGHDTADKHPEETFQVKQIKRIKLTRVTVDRYSLKRRLAFGGDTAYIASRLPESGIWVNTWSHRLRERKTRVIYEEISDPEESDDDE